MGRGRPRKGSQRRIVENKKESSTINDNSSLRRSLRKRSTSSADIFQDNKRIKEAINSPLSDDYRTNTEEPESETDEAGEKKIDKLGNLKDGRSFKSATFTLPTRGDQVFMLAMDPAKQLGFRDSHIFFTKNPALERVRLTEEEKDILVERGMVLAWFRHRDVAVVTARSVFKQFGAKIIKKGKRCRDDYFEAKARAEGFTGETPIIEKKSTELTSLGRWEDLDLYHDDGSSHARQSLLIMDRPINYSDDSDNDSDNEHNDDDDDDDSLYNGEDDNSDEENNNTNEKLTLKNNNKNSNRSNNKDNINADYKKKKRKKVSYIPNTIITSETWLHHAALGARGFNAILQSCRDRKLSFYDVHTNIYQVPNATQPSNCKWITHIDKKNNKNNTTNCNSKSNIVFDDGNSTKVNRLYLHVLENQYDENEIVDALPKNVDKSVTSIIQLPSSTHLIQDKEKKGDDFPIALTEHQHQDSFPIDFTRFHQPRPIIISPASIVGKTQSLLAQQHYLNQVYQQANLNKNLPNGMPYNSFPTMNHTNIFLSNSTTPSYPNHHSLQSKKSQQKDPSNQANSKSTSELEKPQKKSNVCTECKNIHTPNTLTDTIPICDVFQMVKCSKCEAKYHPSCANLTTTKQLAAVESYPWLCPECKICCVCNSAGDETTLMICDGCDRGWHTNCCNPPVEEIPEGSWLCPFCAICHSCNNTNEKIDIMSNNELQNPHHRHFEHAEAPPNENYKYPIYLATYCNPCYIHFEEDRFCPVCLKSFADGEDINDDDRDMVTCDSCERWIHCKCDDTLTSERYAQLCEDEEAKYTCPLCTTDRVVPIDSNSSLAIMALKGISPPCGLAVGVIGGKIKTRGLTEYNGLKVGIPEIIDHEKRGIKPSI
ncbi:unnamed protein product [Cunninghamella blakesleeana]